MDTIECECIHTYIHNIYMHEYTETQRYSLPAQIRAPHMHTIPNQPVVTLFAVAMLWQVAGVVAWLDSVGLGRGLALLV